MSQLHAPPMTFVAMDHETTVKHFVAMWTVEGPRAFRSLERVAVSGRLPLDGDVYLACVLDGPDIITMTLHGGDDDWATVVVRQVDLDAVVEVRSRGAGEADALAGGVERERFERVVDRVAAALDAVMAPVFLRGERR